MLDSIRIENFKGITEPIGISGLTGNNLLIYGDNGTGKSSLVEALRLTFYYDRLKVPKIAGALDANDASRLERQWLQEYNNKQNHVPFSLQFNGANYHPCPIANTQLFIIGAKDLVQKESKISLKQLVGNLDYPDFTDADIANWSEFIIGNTNKALKDVFLEDIEVSLDGSPDFNLIVKDNIRGLTYASDLPTFFNEAKLHLINLLIRLSIIEAMDDAAQDRLLVLDDIISSFDQSNRAFVIKYILDEFKEPQKIILTHNVSYFNLFTYTIKNVKQETNWKFRQLYMRSDDIHISQPDIYENANAIKNAYRNGTLTLRTAPNVIRQYFEVQIHMLSQYLHMESVDESGQIIYRLITSPGEHIYLKRQGHKFLRSENLLAEIVSVLGNTTKNDTQKTIDIDKAIKEYDRTNELQKLTPIIKDVRLYQKLVLHQLSHGRTGLPAFSASEVEACLDLMTRLDDAIHIATQNIYEP